MRPGGLATGLLSTMVGAMAGGGAKPVAAGAGAGAASAKPAGGGLLRLWQGGKLYDAPPSGQDLRVSWRANGLFHDTISDAMSSITSFSAVGEEDEDQLLVVNVEMDNLPARAPQADNLLPPSALPPAAAPPGAVPRQGSLGAAGLPSMGLAKQHSLRSDPGTVAGAGASGVGVSGGGVSGGGVSGGGASGTGRSDRDVTLLEMLAHVGSRLFEAVGSAEEGGGASGVGHSGGLDNPTRDHSGSLARSLGGGPGEVRSVRAGGRGVSGDGMSDVDRESVGRGTARSASTARSRVAAASAAAVAKGFPAFFKYFAYGIDRQTIEEEGEDIPSCGLAGLFVPGSKKKAVLIRWRYDVSKYDESTVARLSANFCFLVERIASLPSIEALPIYYLPVLTDAEREQLEDKFSGRLVPHAFWHEEEEGRKLLLDVGGYRDGRGVGRGGRDKLREKDRLRRKKRQEEGKGEGGEGGGERGGDGVIVAADLSDAAPGSVGRGARSRGRGLNVRDRTLVDLFERQVKVNPAATALLLLHRGRGRGGTWGGTAGGGERGMGLGVGGAAGGGVEGTKVVREAVSYMQLHARALLIAKFVAKKLPRPALIPASHRGSSHSTPAATPKAASSAAAAGTNLEEIVEESGIMLVLTSRHLADALTWMTPRSPRGAAATSSMGAADGNHSSNISGEGRLGRALPVWAVEEVIEGEVEEERAERALLGDWGPGDEGMTGREAGAGGGGGGAGAGGGMSAGVSAGSVGLDVLVGLRPRASGTCCVVYREDELGRVWGVVLQHQGVVNMACAELSSEASLLGVSGLLTLPSVAMWLEPRSLPSLRWVAFSGEPVPRALVWRWLRAGRVVVDIYGAVECSLAATCAVWRPGDRVADTIGRPLPGVHVYILGPNLELLPIGAGGEVCIAGIHVARGYWKRHGETRQRFVSNPYGMGVHDRKLLRTGDRGRWLPDGCVQFLGRLEQQVYIRGLSVEPVQIEEAGSKVDGVARCVVAFRAHDPGRQPYLAAYLLLKPSLAAAAAAVAAAGEAGLGGGAGGEAGAGAGTGKGAGKGGGKGVQTPAQQLLASQQLAAVIPKKVREYFRSTLPPHAVPSAIHVIHHLPWTKTGKADRSRLPLPPADSFFVSCDEDGSVGGTGLGAGGGEPLETAEERAVAVIFAEGGGAGGVVGVALSEAQVLLWVAYHALPHPQLLDECHVWRLQGPVNFPRLQRSLQALVMRHAALRSRFVVWRNSKHKQSGRGGGASGGGGRGGGSSSSSSVRLKAAVMDAAIDSLRTELSAVAAAGASGNAKGRREAGRGAAGAAGAGRAGGGSGGRSGAGGGERASVAVGGGGESKGGGGFVYRALAGLFAPSLFAPSFWKTAESVLECVTQIHTHPTHGPSFKLALVDISGAKLSATEHSLVLVWNPLIFDGVSSSLFYSDLLQIYKAGGSAADLPAVASYADFVLWEKDNLACAGHREWDLGFWKQAVGVPPPKLPPQLQPKVDESGSEGVGRAGRGGRATAVAGAGGKGAGGAGAAAAAAAVAAGGLALALRKGHVEVLIAASTRRRLETYAFHRGATLSMALQTVLHALLHLWTHQHSVAIAVPVARRQILPLQSVIGRFSDVLPVVTDMRKHLSPPLVVAGRLRSFTSSISRASSCVSSRCVSPSTSRQYSVLSPRLSASTAAAAGGVVGPGSGFQPSSHGGRSSGKGDGDRPKSAGGRGAGAGVEGGGGGYCSSGDDREDGAASTAERISAAGEGVSFEQLLFQVREHTLQALQHQSISLRLLASALHPTAPDPFTSPFALASFALTHPGTDSPPNLLPLEDSLVGDLDLEASSAAAVAGFGAAGATGAGAAFAGGAAGGFGGAIGGVGGGAEFGGSVGGGGWGGEVALFPLGLSLRPLRDGRLAGRLTYQVDAVPRNIAEVLARQIERLAEAAVESPRPMLLDEPTVKALKQARRRGGGGDGGKGGGGGGGGMVGPIGCMPLCIGRDRRELMRQGSSDSDKSDVSV
ncbi:unnamed protein product [Closterium sp. Yama58-4]|nr:unnamed protein product [Closterium sp. Yama58-4]